MTKFYVWVPLDKCPRGKSPITWPDLGEDSEEEYGGTYLGYPVYYGDSDSRRLSAYSFNLDVATEDDDSGEPNDWAVLGPLTEEQVDEVLKIEGSFRMSENLLDRYLEESTGEVTDG